MQNLRQVVLAEAKHQLALNLDLLNMLRDDVPEEIRVAVREEWVEPLKRLIEELESNFPIRHDPTQLPYGRELPE
jgi:hypothetical protein